MYDYEDEDLSFLHDEDSDYPNSIQDEERELTEDEEKMCDIIYGTIGELEIVRDQQEGETVTMNRATALKALQLLKAYSTLFDLSLDDYYEEY